MPKTFGQNPQKYTVEHTSHKGLNAPLIAQQIFLAVLYSVLGLTVGCNIFGQLQ